MVGWLDGRVRHEYSNWIWYIYDGRDVSKPDLSFCTSPRGSHISLKKIKAWRLKQCTKTEISKSFC